MIEEMRGSYSVKELCDAFGVSRSGYLAARKRPPSRRAQENAELVSAIKQVHRERRKRSYGSPRMTEELNKRGLACSENRVARLMKDNSIKAHGKKPFKPKTTRQDPAVQPAPNLLAEAGPAQAPGTQLVSDITHLRTLDGWLYLVVVIDLFSRAVLGWKISARADASLVTQAIDRALATGWVKAGAIFHSDRGCQYTASATTKLLGAAGLEQSMSARGYCYDNAFAESFFASLKAEALDEGQPPSGSTMRSEIFDYLETFYNRQRLHSSLDYRTPEEVLEQYLLTQLKSAS